MGFGGSVISVKSTGIQKKKKKMYIFVLTRVLTGIIIIAVIIIIITTLHCALSEGLGLRPPEKQCVYNVSHYCVVLFTRPVVFINREKIHVCFSFVCRLVMEFSGMHATLPVTM